MNAPDVIVIGLGVAGAAVSHELARRGARVIGLDRYTPPHTLGSSHGKSRIIRQAYYEHPLYVPLVQRAAELWQELEELTGSVLLRRTGGLMVGPRDGVLVRGALTSATLHGLLHELIDAAEITRRFPGFTPAVADVGVLEHDAGVLLAEPCVRTLLTLARGYGAELHTDSHVTAWHVTGAGVAVHTTRGAYTAGQVVLAAGAWLNPLLSAGPDALQLPLNVERQTSHWFEPAPGAPAYRADRYPIALWEYAPDRVFYTFPDMGRGVKAGIHHDGPIVDPDQVEREVLLAEEARVRTLLERYQAGASYRLNDASVCLYTNTPDGHFIVGRHPTAAGAIILSACSGHGFKFAPALAELVADMALEDVTPDDVTPFGSARFG